MILCSFHSFGQGEANNWYFGRNAGITFNTNPPSPNTNGALNTLEGCSSISDTGGNLLFYTDGRTIWDRNHNIMPNANYFGGTGLHGDPSSTQSGLIVPHPTLSDLYYVFTVDEPHHQNANAFPNSGPADANGNPLPNYQEGEQFTVPQEDDGFNNGFNYSMVDMSLRNGFGDVIESSRNSPLVTYDSDNDEDIKFKSSEKITAVAGADCNSIWVITHFKDKFYSFLIDENGVDTTPVVSQLPPFIGLNGYRRNAIGYIKASPDGEKLIIANLQTSNNSGGNGNVYLYDFNDATGEVTNPISLIQNVSPYGVEFSPDSEKAYASVTVGQQVFIYQWNLTAVNIPNSLFVQNTSMTQATALQLGPNGKIYTPQIGQPILNVINNPNELGGNMGYTASLGLGAIGLQSRNSTYGLPPFIQSIFNSRVDIVSENPENEAVIETQIFVCEGDIANLGYDYENDATYQWFENGDLITEQNGPFIEISLPEGQQLPYETAYTLEIFPENGECKVTGIANVSFIENPIVTNTFLVQCVTDFENNSALFNLNNAKNELVSDAENTVDNFAFSFYETLDDLENEIAIEDISNYENTTNPQQMYVLVTDNETSCSNIAELNLIVDDITGTEEIELIECDTNLDGLQVFDLTLANEESNLTPTFFYTSINDALRDEDRIENPSDFPIETAYQQTLYYRTGDNDSCGVLGILTLQVVDLPFLFEDKTQYYCLEDEPNTISIFPSVPLTTIEDYTYFWPSNNAESFSIQVNQPGTYQVLVTEISTGCESLQNIVVTNSNLADFEVIIEDGDETSNRITVVINQENSLGDYEYSLENENNRFQDSPVFSDLKPGFYTVFVRDKYGCGISSKNIGVVGAMRFFTPNNDGINDFWNVTGLPARQNARVYVFDRFGKLLAEFDAQNSQGWDGNYNGKPMLNNDYWYLIELDDGRKIRGNLTLKR